MRRINYHYDIQFKETWSFDWSFRSGPVRYEGYERLEDGLYDIISLLNKEPNSRQAILTLNNRDYMSCLINIQWLIEEGTLYCITNFRSQHSTMGRPQDTQLIMYLCTQVKAGLDIDKVQIEVNVADYHYYELLHV